MAKCENCKSVIKYNKFKRWRKKLLCISCFKRRREIYKKVTEEANVADIITNPEDTGAFIGGATETAPHLKFKDEE